MSGFEAPIVAEAVGAEVGTSALASEVLASNALAAANMAAYTPAAAGALSAVPAGMAGMAAGLGSLGSAVPGMYGVGTATGIPTLTQQLATASPEVLAQIQGALQPALLSTPEIAPEVAGNAVKNALFGTTAGYGDTAGMIDVPEKTGLEKLIDSSKYLTKAKNWWDKQDTEDKLLYGGAASLAPTVMDMLKKKKTLSVAAPYSGPLSKYSFNPASYTAQQLAQPTPYSASYAVGGTPGGISDLGAYSDGGRMLKGPGDGMSDDIPASIAGKQPARLANEEFVIPADVVSHLGNGSSEAGAKQLYKMMDRVRQARTGTEKQGTQINPEKYLA